MFGAYPLFPVFFLFQKTRLPDDDKKTAESDNSETNFNRICCPLCKWQPQKSNRWICLNVGFPENFYEACGTSWNTFETRGRCPGCAHQWRWTTCLRCHEHSLHEDWYENKKDE